MASPITSPNVWAEINDEVSNDVWRLVGAGAPTNGGSGTGNGLAGPGSTYTDFTNKNVYINTNTKASPTWSLITDTSRAQTLTNKTLTSPTITTPTISAPVIANSVQSVAAAGSVQGDAAAITASSPGNILATGADSTKGVLLPAATAGMCYFLKNADAANNILKVYPSGTNTINALSASTAISMAAKTSAIFMCVVANSWLTIPLLPS